MAYMSPEQIQGDKVDHRSDIFSFGTVLYELIAGQNPFDGEHQHVIAYSIVNEEPEPLTAKRTGVPIALEHIINKCMAKEPSRRYQHLDELPVDLREVTISETGTNYRATASGTEKHQAQPDGKRMLLSWQTAVPAVIFVCLINWLIFWFISQRGTIDPKPVIKTVIPLPGNERLALGSRGGLAISSNGERLVFVAGADNDTRIHLRQLNQFNTIPLPGTNGATSPFFSPDNKWIGFYADGKIKKLLLTSKMPLVVCEVGSGFAGATWLPNNAIVVGFVDKGLMQVDASGGSLKAITTAEERSSHRWPARLPGGEAVVFTVWPEKGNYSLYIDNADISVFSRKTEEWHSIVHGGTRPFYSASGHILYYSRIGGLMAIPFDPSDFLVKGAPVPVIGDIAHHESGYAYFAISDDASLSYIPRPKRPARTRVWVDRKGNTTPLTQLPAALQGGYARIAPDGKELVIMAARNIWLYDLDDNSSWQLTYTDDITFPIWEPDGKHLTYKRIGINRLFRKSADGSGEEENIRSDINLTPGSWSSVDELLVCYTNNPGTLRDVKVLSVQDDSVVDFAVSEANEHSPVFSPDGKWIAYCSDQTGRDEIFVQPYPATGAQHKVSIDGGREPMWGPGGDELFYFNRDQLMVVVADTEGVFRSKTHQVLFTGDYKHGTYRAEYDIHPDGDRFLMVKLEDETTTNDIHVVFNYFEELKRKVPSDN
jgi:serine/threonine-protein kinase